MSACCAHRHVASRVISLTDGRKEPQDPLCPQCQPKAKAILESNLTRTLQRDPGMDPSSGPGL